MPLACASSNLTLVVKLLQARTKQTARKVTGKEPPRFVGVQQKKKKKAKKTPAVPQPVAGSPADPVTPTQPARGRQLVSPTTGIPIPPPTIRRARAPAPVRRRLRPGELALRCSFLLCLSFATPFVQDFCRWGFKPQKLSWTLSISHE